MCPKCFLKIAEKPNNYQSYLANFRKFCDNISHKVFRPTQFLEKIMEVLEWSTFQKEIGALPQLNVAAYWKSSNTKVCTNNLSQILAKNINNGERGLVSEFM